MSLRFRTVPLFLGLTCALLQASPALAGWEDSVQYGANTRMDLYTPDQVAASPAVVVVLHYCSGNSTSGRSWLQQDADRHGFLIIAPGAGGNCFDAGLGRSGERANIVQMVEYAVEQKGADPTRVFAVGASSGACMTQALLASYPEVFAAGSSLAGVPAGAWTGGNNYAWSTAGTSGGQAWGDKVRQASPSFTGTRPRIQLWHGVQDETIGYEASYPHQVAQWTNVHGVTEADATMEMIKPPGAQDTWARTSYKDDATIVVVEANSAPNAMHELTGRGLWGDVVRFFRLDQPATGGSGGMGGMAGTGAAGESSGGVAGTNSTVGGSGGVATSGSGGTGIPSAGAGGGGTGTAGSGNGGTGPSSGGSGNAAGGTAPSTGGSTSGAGSAMGGSAGSATTSGTGGAPNAGRGGTSTVAGRAGAAPGPGDGGDADDDGGCSIGSAGSAPNTMALAAVGLGALGMLMRRRRR